MSQPLPTFVTATQMQQKSGQIIKRVFLQREHFLVMRDGYPVAAIIPVSEYEKQIQPVKDSEADQ